MKKILSVLLALLFICAMPALALESSGYPVYDEANFHENHLGGSFSGEDILLEFDSSSEYSQLLETSMEACFFAFNEGEDHYIELYLELPTDIASGDHFSSGDVLSASDSFVSLSFYEIGSDTESFYYAGSIVGVVYPDGCSFDITIDEAKTSGSAIEVSGSLSALLYRFSENMSPTNDTLALNDVRFHFEFPLSSDSNAKKEEVPSGIAPKFTLPPDYVSL